MIRGLHITDDRGVKRPVHANDVLAGEPWNAVRSADQPSSQPPAIYRTWLQRICVSFSQLIGVFILSGVLSRSLNLPLVAAMILIVVTYAALYLVQRRYGANINSAFWRRRLSRVPDRSARQHIRVSIARDRICPCCAYGLGDAPRENDGCTPCPECGAAWRIELWSNDAGIYRPPAITSTSRVHDRSPVNTGDARGVIVPLLAKRNATERRPTIITSPGRPERFRLRVATLAWALQLVITAGIAWLAIAMIGPDELPAWLGTVILVALVAAMIGMAVKEAYSHQLAMATHPFFTRSMVAANLCPCCESPLRTTPSPIDGCLLCDTCGSAWDPPLSQPRA